MREDVVTLKIVSRCTNDIHEGHWKSVLEGGSKPFVVPFFSTAGHRPMSSSGYMHFCILDIDDNDFFSIIIKL